MLMLVFKRRESRLVYFGWPVWNFSLNVWRYNLLVVRHDGRVLPNLKKKISHIYSNPDNNPFTKIGCQMSGFLACTHFNWYEKKYWRLRCWQKHVWEQIEKENSGLFFQLFLSQGPEKCLNSIWNVRQEKSAILQKLPKENSISLIHIFLENIFSADI